MLVSGKHLELASNVFKTMLTGPFIEGSADSSGLRRITASDWDHRALKIVLAIMHGYHRDVPRSIDFYLLVKVALIVNYYDCLESVEVYTDIWLKDFEHNLPRTYGRDCILYLFLSWVFSKPEMFQRMAHLAMRHSQKLIEAEDFPIPAVILRRLITNSIPQPVLTQTAGEINTVRQFTISEIFSAIYELLDRLQDEQECSFECSSMLLGILTKELKRHGILYPRSAPPYNGFSIDGLQKMIRELKRPSWYSGPSKHSHHICDVQVKLGLPLAEAEFCMYVFDLQDFQSVKNHRRD